MAQSEMICRPGPLAPLAVTDNKNGRQNTYRPHLPRKEKFNCADSLRLMERDL